jgi:hypothetical protein
MPKPEIYYARLELRVLSDRFKLIDLDYETPDRLHEVLTEEFYMEPFTKEVVRLNPEVFAAWSNYRTDRNAKMPAAIQAVGKFQVKGQEVELLDIAFN